MVFSSYGFLFGFLPMVLAGAYALARIREDRIVVVYFLVGASLFFYAYWDYRLVWVMVVSILFNYFVGRVIARRSPQPRVVLILGIAANLALLAYFKYTNFFVENIGALTGADLQSATIILPIGISFFTFHQIAYLVEVNRGNMPSHRLPHYALFVSFFPQLIAGPIVYPRETLPQFVDGRADWFRAPLFAQGITLLAMGLAKKVLIADTVAGSATPVFVAAAAGQEPTFIEAWSGALAYTIQVYFDFAAYSDMAIGLGLLLGVRLPINFMSPYRAHSIIEFWRRWHMTLSRFLRDYLYFSLGGNRRGKVRQYANLLIVMVLGGLWHGASWTFVLWGFLHGLALAGNHLWRQFRPRRITPASPIVGVTAWATTFLFVVIAWVFFRATTLPAAISMLRGMAGLNGVVVPETYRQYLGVTADIVTKMGVQFAWMPLFSGLREIAVIGLLLGACWWLPNSIEIVGYRGPAATQDRVRRRRPISALRWRPNAAWAAATAILISVCALNMFETGAFLYFQF